MIKQVINCQIDTGKEYRCQFTCYCGGTYPPVPYDNAKCIYIILHTDLTLEMRYEKLKMYYVADILIACWWWDL